MDENKFDQVITNLVGNAFKFTPSGGSITVSVTHLEAEGRVRVSVTDTGVGIAPVNIMLCHGSLLFTMIDSQENIGKLFQGVVQFSPGTLQQGGGAGWGLYSKYESSSPRSSQSFLVVHMYVFQSAKA